MKIRVRAHAKVNLALRVGGVGDDGLHRVATVMQTVSLADRLLAAHRGEVTGEEDRISGERVTGERDRITGEGRDGAPVDLEVRWASPPFGGPGEDGEPPEIPVEENTAWRAAVALAEHLGGRGRRLEPLSLRLEKHVPAGSGLGGGSSDAVAALMACARLWCGPGELPEGAVLEEIAAGIGADVPFFLVGGTALATGSGRDVEPLEPLERTWLVLAAPPAPISTAAVYEDFDSEPAAARGPAGREPDPPAYRPVLEKGWAGNDLTRVARRRVPEIGRLLESLEEAGAGVARMSGSGSACFGSFPGRRRACRVARRLRARGWWARAAVTVDRAQHAAALGARPSHG